MKHYTVVLTLLFIHTIAFVIPERVQAEANRSYLLGVFPHLPPRELEKVYAPIAALISTAIGRPVQIGSSASYEKFMENLDNQLYDIAFVQPFDYVRIASKFSYQPVAARDELLAAIFVTKKDSPIKNIEDLRGKRVAMPPDVAAVSVLAMQFLVKHGIDVNKDIMISRHRSHVSCLQQVLIDAADTCVTAYSALRFFTNKMNTEMSVIAESPSIPHTLFATHPRVTSKENSDILSVLLSLHQTKEGREILERGQLEHFKKTYDTDYDIVRTFEKEKL